LPEENLSASLKMK